MRLRVVTPLAVVVDEEDVASVRAEDASGSFGVLPGHVDFLTSLTISVVRWQGAGRARYCAVRGGVFSVAGGREVTIAAREAVAGDDLATLDQTVLARFREESETEKMERVDVTRLHLAAIRQIMRHLRPGGREAFR
jgi:F-type H+-transporting ATPase subunit epsilon